MGVRTPEANPRGVDIVAANAAVSRADPPKPAGAPGILEDGLG